MPAFGFPKQPQEGWILRYRSGVFTPEYQGLSTSGVVGDITFTKPGSTPRGYALPDATGTIPLYEFAGTFTAAQTIDLGTGSLAAYSLSGQSLRLTAADGSVGGRMQVLGFGNSAFSFNGVAIGGTRAVPTYTPAGYILCRFNGAGWDQAGSAIATGATLSIDTGSLWSATNRETIIYFSGTPSGSTTQSEWWRLQNGCQTLGGISAAAGNGLLQRAAGTTRANGDAWGTDTFVWRDSAGSLTTEGSFGSNSPTGGIGYKTGAGGTVTQATSKATAVTLSRVSGTITLNGAALASATSVSFTWTNTAIAATDVVVCVHDSVGTLGGYGITVTPAAGSATVTIRNNTAGSLSEAIVLRFAIIKAVTT